MKNKVNLKKYLIRTSILTSCLLIIFLIINIYEYHSYTVNFNNKLLDIVNLLQEEYPNVKRDDVLEILNSEKNNNKDIFKYYGIDINKNSIVIKNDKDYQKFLVLNTIFFLISIILVLLIFRHYDRKKDKDIKDITRYIEEINKKNYELNIDSNSEDELSILKNEIYKTTILLKEAAENSNLDKINLKNSLEDISHQLKTPLTSILIMLDNLIDDKDMESAVRNKFILSIKREVSNINFLVGSILKLSKFDANTIKFIKKNNDLREIIGESLENVSALCDLRNIQVEVEGEGKANLICDFNWQVEALTNILKNCVDYSSDFSKINIEYEENKVYSSVTIKDNGKGIADKDMPHIFERFYKGANSNSDSIGIGLALAKTIIESDNGTIQVSSSKNGTNFIIKYFKV